MNVVATPDPTVEEAAAIVAACEALWPRPAVLAPLARSTPPWRFSGRWWTEPASRPRARPR